MCDAGERERERERERDEAAKGGVSLGFEWREDEGGNGWQRGQRGEEGKIERERTNAGGETCCEPETPNPG